jgi:hypothetical protein
VLEGTLCASAECEREEEESEAGKSGERDVTVVEEFLGGY